MSQEEKDTGFRVTDKRLFTAEGDLIEEVADGAPGPAGTIPSASPGPAPQESPHAHEEFQMTFETLVMSLSSTAMVQLGIMVDPTTNQLGQNIPAAKQTIDILEILQQKTKGNLMDSEGKFLDNILYELRMMFLEVSQTIKAPL
jgi:hypothetical protein